MNNELMQEMLDCLKKINNISNAKVITIPDERDADTISLSGTNFDFYFDLNRGGHRKPKCTFQLREQNHPSIQLFRIDLIGREHTNPKGNYSHASETIPCPHVHLSTYKDYGTGVALPISDPLVRMNLKNSDLKDLCKCLKATLKRLNVANINHFKYNINQSFNI